MNTDRKVKLFSPLDPITLATKLKTEMEKREDSKDFMSLAAAPRKKSHCSMAARIS